MTWIDDDRDELQRLHKSAAELKTRESQIAAASGEVYEALWDEIVERISEADDKGIRSLLTNGAAYERKIIIPQEVAGAYPKEYALKLAKDQQAITFSGPNGKIVLPLELGADKVVRI